MFSIKQCSEKLIDKTKYLHIIALIIGSIGGILQIYSSYKKIPYGIYLSVSIVIMLILRLPNQICVALIEDDGWLSVIGTFIGIISMSILTYFNVMNKKIGR